MVAYLCSPASAHISGKVFGVQGDTVEIYRPWTSAAVIENGKQRWDVDQLADRVMELFVDSGIAERTGECDGPAAVFDDRQNAAAVYS